MTRSELDKMKETLKKGLLFDGIVVDDRPSVAVDGATLTPVVITPTHIGWDYISVDDEVTS